MPDTINGSDEVLWYLEGFTEESAKVRRIPIVSFPFTIGRRPGLGMTLVSNLVSQRHAEISREGDQLVISDLGSTNGTFLNGDRLLQKHRLEEGDIIHFSRFEFRLGSAGAEEAEEILASTIAVSEELPQLMIDRSRILREMMRRREVTSVFQPVVELASSTTIGFEVLGRGLMDGRPTTSGPLFAVAGTLGVEAELSRLFRATSVEDCSRLPGDPLVFLNTHPTEVGSSELLESLRDFRRRAPDLDVVLEIHESAMTSPSMMRNLTRFLDEIGFRLAYDDFGAGQARLQELATIQPDYLKFDISLIRNIDGASSSHQHVISSLVQMALDLGIAPIAEGIEREAEARTCRELGFQYGQGFLLGTPAALEELDRAADDKGR